MSDPRLVIEDDRGIHHLVMSQGPNALDEMLMESLRSALASLAVRGAPPLLLRSGHRSLFCPGWDLKRLAAAGYEDVRRFLAQFNALLGDLFSYPGPTAAAITGHAVAGGCLLAIACDLRVMALGPARIGLSEVNLGVPVPATAVRMLRRRLPPKALDDLVLHGEGMSAERALELGLVQQVCDGAEVLAATGAALRRLAAKPSRAFGAVKAFLLDTRQQPLAGDDPGETAVFLDCWFSEDTQERLRSLVSSLAR